MSSTGFKRPVLFDEALKRAVQFVRQHFANLRKPVLLVRDVYGRLRIALDDRNACIDSSALDSLVEAWSDELGAYSPGDTAADVFLLASHLFAPDALFSSSDIQSLPDTPDVRLLERQITGQDWLRAPLTPAPKPRRATLFGIKGGVGRSTALTIWAKFLAEEHDLRVLVVDLDLESPGLGSMLLHPGQGPQFGLVDYLVEEAVGQGNEVLQRLYSTSSLVNGGKGEIIVVPAYGLEVGDYLAKLSRIYQGLPEGEGPADFAGRICSAVARIEETFLPDIVLLDSRAGLHDIAAMAIVRMQALAFLFAVNTPQTFAAYRLLFDNFRTHPQRLAGFRNNLQAVAALVPDTGRAEYLESFRANFYDLFASNIYEAELDAGEEVFNFSLEDDSAPHNPIPIHWYRWFLDFDPINRRGAMDLKEVQAAFGTFTERATHLLLA